MLENYSALPIIEVTLHIFLAPEIGADITGRKNTNHIYIYIYWKTVYLILRTHKTNYSQECDWLSSRSMINEYS